MQNEVIQRKLRDAAEKISAYLTTLQLEHEVNFYQYMINVRITQGAKQVTLSVAYSPNKNRWTPYATDNWAKEVIVPRIEHLLVKGHAPIHAPQIATSTQRSPLTTAYGVDYFANALESLRILSPFAKEYIDFSVIGEQAKKGLRRVLNDPQWISVDRSSLVAALEISLSPDYSTAKEYLFQCLTLCHLPIPTSL